MQKMGTEKMGREKYLKLQQQHILLKILYVINYITFPPENSLWTNRGGRS